MCSQQGRVAGQCQAGGEPWGALECLSEALGSLWWLRQSWTGHAEHSLPSHCCTPWCVMCNAVLSFNAGISWELCVGLVSEHKGLVQTMGPPVQEPRHRMLWLSIPCGVVLLWVLIHPCGKLLFACCDGGSALFELPVITALGIILLRRDDRDILTLGIMPGKEGERSRLSWQVGGSFQGVTVPLVLG